MIAKHYCSHCDAWVYHFTSECPHGEAAGSLTASASPAARDLLPNLVADYLASDGSFGLYDARECIKIRERLQEIIGMDKIKAKQKLLLCGLEA